MTQLTMVGITFRGTSLALLERTAGRKDDRPDMLARLRTLGCSEAIVLSTGSRVEIYVANASRPPAELLEVLLDVFAEHSGGTHDELREVAELRTGPAVVEHLFHLTAGLSSRVFGEVEILRQSRTALRAAKAAGMTNLVLGQLFAAAMRSGRQVRATTSLDLEGLAEDGAADPGLAAALSTAAVMASTGARAFVEVLAARKADLVVQALSLRVEQICQQELLRTGCLADLDSDELIRSAHAIAGKLLHAPTIAMRRAASAGDVNALRQLCDLYGIPLDEVDLADNDVVEAVSQEQRVAV
ncbi:MAG: glutamyl-tRNA reductase [Actinomycetota bacterium]|jgi:glutamyl-tRNA reductase|nr:glutamyl-tRNA reductase [Actinomycetota bacterium]